MKKKEKRRDLILFFSSHMREEIFSHFPSHMREGKWKIIISLPARGKGRDCLLISLPNGHPDEIERQKTNRDMADKHDPPVRDVDYEPIPSRRSI